MGVHMLVSIGIRLRCGLAKSGSAADERLVDMLPETLGPHECLVVKASGNKARELAVDGTHVKTERWPAVLRLGGKTVKNFNLCSPQIRLHVAACADADQRIHFLGAQADDTARTVILEAAAKQFLTLGQNGRCQRIASKARYFATIKLEVHALGSVNAAATRSETIGFADHVFAFALAVK